MREATTVAGGAALNSFWKTGELGGSGGASGRCARRGDAGALGVAGAATGALRGPKSFSATASRRGNGHPPLQTARFAVT